MTKTIGERLQEELDNKGLSAPLTAELTGQKNREVTAWLANEGEPYAQALSRLAEAGVDIYFVLTGKPGPILNEHFQLRERLDFLLREHLHKEAASIARKMVAIAEQAYADLKKLSTVGMHTSSGFIKTAGGPGYHAGYDYLTDKAYLLGVCSAAEAIQLCEQAAQQRWDGEWRERIEGIRDNEHRMERIKNILRELPDILQADLIKQYPDDADSLTLYYAEKRGEIIRTKKGRSYTLSLPASR